VKRSALLIASVLSLAGCKKEQQSNIPIVCKAEVAGSEAEEVAGGEVPAEIWFLIMLSNYNGDTKEVGRPVKDCSGREVHAAPDEAMAACLVGEEPPRELPPEPLTEEDLMITPTEPGKMLVWVKTTKYDNGEASGPIATAQWTKRGVIITSIGTLRAQPDRAAMRLEPMAKGKVLVIESRACENGDPKKCSRLVRLLPQSGLSFLERPLVDEKGACIGKPEVELFREKMFKLPDGTQRKFELARSIDFAEGVVVINEQVTIKDSDPTQPELPPKLFRKASVQRPLRLVKQGLATKRGLWNTMVDEFGSVALTPEKTKKKEDPEASEGEGEGEGEGNGEGAPAASEANG
jgi:hypothetical protein